MDKNSAKKKLSNTNKPENNVTEQSSKAIGTTAAEEKIQHLLILNAWRHQKEKNKDLEIDIKNLTNQVERLRLQIYTLKHLLDAEKARVVHFSSDLRKVLASLEECKHEKHALLKEKEQLEVRLRATEEKLGGIETEYKNQKNELIMAKSEARNWENQLEKERVKLSKLKDERKFFTEEVRSKENLLVWEIRSFEQFSRFFNILQSKSNNPALPWDEPIGRINPVPEIFKKRKNSKKQQTVVVVKNPQENPELKALLAKVERKITPEEDESRIEELEKWILGKTEENSLILYIHADIS